MDIYSLSRKFWDYSFENPDKIRPNHIAMYFFAIEHCNRLGWKDKFGFPTTVVMDAISIRSYNTFIKTLNELVEIGFIEMVEKSKNQYSANIIALSNFNKANNKALDKALTKHSTKQVESTIQSTVQSIDSIYIQTYNNTNLQDIPPAAKQKSFKSLTEEEFKFSLVEFVDEFGKKTVREFFDYWSEMSPSGKMKFQLNKTWDSKKRLITWKRNEGKFGNTESHKQQTKVIPGPWNV